MDRKAWVTFSCVCSKVSIRQMWACVRANKRRRMAGDA